MIDKIKLYDLLKESFLLLDFGDRLFLEHFDLTVPRYYALHHIASAPGLSPSLLSRFMFCDKSNITRLIHGLAHDGLVERRPHERDGRIQRLYLTAAGLALLENVAQAHGRYIEERLTMLDGRAADGIIDTLAHLNQSLAEALDSPWEMALN